MATRRRHGEGSVYQDGDRWKATVDLGIVAGKRVRRTVTAKTEKEVLAKLKAMRTQLDKGVLPTRVKTGEWLTWWLEHVAKETVRPSTHRGYTTSVTQYLIPALGAIPLQDLRPEHIEAMHTWMTDDLGLSTTTAHQAHQVLRSALKTALQRERVTRNVAAITPAPKARLNPHESLTVEEAKKVLASAQTPRELCRLTCALVLGMRQGEVLGLRWVDVEVRDGVTCLIIEEAVARITGKGMQRVDVKSAASHREIPLPEAVAAILKAHRDSSPAGEEYIFPGIKGGAEDPKRDWKAWRDACGRAGVKRVPLHGARGTAASLLADMGVPDWRIGQILGHTAWVSRRHYIRGDSAQKVKALDGLIGQLLGKQGEA